VDWIRVNALAVPAWGAIGQAQAGTGLAQVARLGGVAGVSAFVAGACGAIIAASSPGRGRDLAATRSVAAAWAGAIVALYLCAEPALRAIGNTALSRSLEVLVVQPHVPPEERAHADLQLAHLATLERMTRESVAQAVRPLDLITWPEASLTLQRADAEAALERVRDVAVAARTPIVLGLSELLANGDTRNTAVWIDPEAGVRGQYEKARPIPVLEARSSWAGWAGWVLFGLPVDRGLVRAGPSEGRGLVRDGIATVLCFEVFFPDFATRATGDDARAIVNLASDSWTPTSAAREQELRFASFRAVESRLPLVRTSHGGPSVVFDAYGREIARIPDGQSGTLVISVSAPSVSIAADTAMLFVLGSGGALIGLALRRFLVGGGMRR
jgi:apolipoprotein N-acyltransferase